MKNPTFTRSSHGFTLVELLVVIGIIAMLGGLSMVVVPKALNSAKKTTSLAEASKIEQGVIQFYDEYSVMPLEDAGDSDLTLRSDNQEGAELLTVLMGKESTSGKMLNKKQISYYNPKEAKGKKGGVVFASGNSNRPQALYDAFGNPYFIALNCNYDEFLMLKDSVGGQNRNQQLRDRKVAVYSAGADKKMGTEDDVMTWQQTAK